MRQQLSDQPGIVREYDPGPGVSISSLEYEYPAGYRVPDHAHASDQLIYAIRGSMEVSSRQTIWLIPPQFALWIPFGTLHRIHMPAAVSMRTLYFRPGLATRTSSPGSQGRCEVIHVTSLLRELIVETVRLGQLRAGHRHERALRDLTILHLANATPVPTFVTLPVEKRALAVAQAVLADPAAPNRLDRRCMDAGLSVRTLERLFHKEVGIDFDAWRRQVRLTRAVQLLAAGSSVKEVAFAVGYAQPSAFVESFRRTFGTTPKVWVTSAGLVER